LKPKYRILKYSGNTDGAVPTLGTVRWVEGMNWPVTKQWSTFKVDNHLAGYYEERDQFTLLIIHGAGHMAPQHKRPETYYAIFNWLFQKGL
jgi:serine carboxypeptidase-like clade 2